MTEKEMYNFINEQNQETGFAYNEKERGLSNVFSAQQFVNNSIMC